MAFRSWNIIAFGASKNLSVQQRLKKSMLFFYRNVFTGSCGVKIGDKV
jgi:hypothetical protein